MKLFGYAVLSIAAIAIAVPTPTNMHKARSVNIYQAHATPTQSSGTIKNQAAMDAYNAQNYQ
ncbi:hypothetical protein E3P92_00276 [Wallemia ichthyophaga]|uniref:Uncharacterized protein n=2 Tax=Wallemia ichthyophaga TaxID=245174 RepID=A0A4T0J4N8_WALIC|nr:uncharacterized protein J056_000347 [Wallemia ichthyophaga EXF-994]TIA84093.1 hypothetical protein E3P98_00418 [Wallemia ichthyophaga]EOR04983.1 hypothetical protein J056_000347 [Wallemia ichthyophaga EXF-994]TIA93474.1 hypothetical protein E3P97_00968 [Wallemia ichthyophaga]TIA97079.1 hypothetical protein E3P95_03008 [Wallemia ichthyophaga]TIA97713.1 hypothetical protein E3P94_03220 [Wallemia ichthyophaga]